MFLSQLDLTTALRPYYLPDEVLLFVQDNVGLYEGKYKLPNHQNGQVYLTSHRICYVDKTDPRKNSLSFELRELENFDFYGGFLKSSPKIILYPKPPKRSSFTSRAATAAAASSRPGTASPIQRANSPFRPSAPSAPPTSTASWVCTICSFSNPMPRGFDPSTATVHTPLDPCGTCGVKPELKVVLKAAITNATSRQVVQSPIRAPLPFRPGPRPGSPTGPSLTPLPPAANGNPSDASSTFQCPVCTFLNHPSLLICELCNSPLISQDLPATLTQAPAELRTDSPGPTLSTPSNGLAISDYPEMIKISFRGGGEKIFYERLKGSMIQRKWILGAAPPVPRENQAAEVHSPGGTISSNPVAPSKHKVGGIAGLEQRVGNTVKKNEVAIGTAFEDLESLMASAKEIVALAETFARQSGNGDSSSALVAESVSQLGLVTTKDIVGSGGSASESLYLSELSRNIAEYLTDDARGVLKKAGGIITLVDLWAMFNRVRGGVELVSPNDFEKAVRQWEKLRLPVRLRTFKSGVLVVQSKDRTDESTVKAIQAWMRDLHAFPPDRPVAWDWQEFGRGVTAQDVAERFGWSIGVAEEELEMAEEKGVLCREQGIEGVKYWENYIDTGEYRRRRKTTPEDQIYKALKESGML